MKALLPLAETIAKRLIARRETIAVAESSTGGLIAASLLAVPGASAYFLGGAVVYTKAARAASIFPVRAYTYAATVRYQAPEWPGSFNFSVQATASAFLPDSK